MARHVTSSFSRTKLAHLSLVVGGRTTPAGSVAPPVKPKGALESVPGIITAEAEEKARQIILAESLGDTGLTVTEAIAQINRLYFSPTAPDLRRVGCLTRAFDDVGLHVCPFEFESDSTAAVFLLVVRPKDLCKSFPELKPYKQSIRMGMTLG